jgi:hypothetical protein
VLQLYFELASNGETDGLRYLLGNIFHVFHFQGAVYVRLATFLNPEV